VWVLWWVLSNPSQASSQLHATSEENVLPLEDDDYADIPFLEDQHVEGVDDEAFIVNEDPNVDILLLQNQDAYINADNDNDNDNGDDLNDLMNEDHGNDLSDLVNELPANLFDNHIPTRLRLRICMTFVWDTIPYNNYEQ
jgi:hypothetical protein